MAKATKKILSETDPASDQLTKKTSPYKRSVAQRQAKIGCPASGKKHAQHEGKKRKKERKEIEKGVEKSGGIRGCREITHTARQPLSHCPLCHSFFLSGAQPARLKMAPPHSQKKQPDSQTASQPARQTDRQPDRQTDRHPLHTPSLNGYTHTCTYVYKSLIAWSCVSFF